MTFTLDPRLLSDGKRRQLLAHSREELHAHPTAFYRAGMDALAAAGVVMPQQDYVLIRAITRNEVAGMAAAASSIGIEIVADDRLGDVLVYEIVAVGPVVEQIQQMDAAPAELLARQDVGVGMVRLHYPPGSLRDIVPGNHCMSVATASDAMDAGGDGIFQLVRACFLPAAWAPDVADKVADVVDESRALMTDIMAAKAERDARIAAEREAERRSVVVPLDDDAHRAPAVHIPPEHRSAG